MKQNSIPLSGLKIGDRCLIDSFSNDYVKLKMLELGCLPGEEILIERFAPLGDPMAILVAGSILSIRIDEADSVLVIRMN
jgi:ferrous iron transport protein A